MLSKSYRSKDKEEYKFHEALRKMIEEQKIKQNPAEKR